MTIDMKHPTQVIKIDPVHIDFDKIKIITGILNRDGIIAYPTDTFYGLGGNCFSKNANQRIFALKKRAPSKPLSVVISDLNEIPELVLDVPPQFKILSDRFWPGALTLVFKANRRVPKELLGSKGTIGVRLPDHPWLRKLVKYTGFPITSTSANISGEKEFEDPEDVIRVFFGKVDIIVDGGVTQGILPSTVVDLTFENPKILREGAIPASVLRKYIE